MATKPMSPEERAKVFKALADPRRVAIVEQLARGSECGTILAESLGISIALLSHHWEILVQAGLLRKERKGQLRVCSLDAERLCQAMTMGGVGGPASGSSALPPVAKRHKARAHRQRGTRKKAKSGSRAPR